jgi:hypothetical protein
MDNVQKACHFNNKPSSQTFRRYLLIFSCPHCGRSKYLSVNTISCAQQTGLVTWVLCHVEMVNGVTFAGICCHFVQWHSRNQWGYCICCARCDVFYGQAVHTVFIQDIFLQYFAWYVWKCIQVLKSVLSNPRPANLSFLASQTHSYIGSKYFFN